MSSLVYTRDHEWIDLNGDIATIGITDHAQEQLGELVFVELPAAGAELAKGDEAAVVESVKAASEVYAPLSGEVTEANDALGDDPAKVNEDPTGAGWFFKMRISDTSQLGDLMDEKAYQAFVASLD